MPNQAPSFDAGPPDYALAYAELGWRVLPIKPGGKHPQMAAWQTNASNKRKAIDGWWNGLYKGHGVGVATGAGSGVWVLDVDISDGKGGAESLAALERAHGALPVTVEAITGTGGRHLYFSWPEGRSPRTNRGQLGDGLDVRGEGGQVLAPPTIHPNGTPYDWTAGRSPWEIDTVPAPGWLLDLVDPPPPPVVETTGTPLSELAPPAAQESIADWYRRTHRWEERLLTDNWTPLPPHGHEQYWCRPGKTERDGHSAVLHLPDGPFVIFSTDASLSRYFTPDHAVRRGEGWAYSLFDYYTVAHHGGDRSAAAKRLVEIRDGHERHGLVLGETPTGTSPDALLLAMLISWPQFWSRDQSDEDWLVWPLVPHGRGVALYAPAKAGKSLIVLALVALAATGGLGLDGVRRAPLHVLYLDYEMTQDDLQERLEDMGYGPDTDLSHLHYASLPSLPPLDTAAGAQAVLRLAQLVGAQLVVIDTLGRAVDGEENEADTLRAFYRHTGLALKAAGIGFLRTDHAGKDLARGQRGTSAKNDDVDVVWQLTRNEGGVTLRATHRRMSWVPETVVIEVENEAGWSFRVNDDGRYPVGTKQMAAVASELGLPTSASVKTTAKLCRKAGHSGSTDLFAAVVRWRKKESETYLATSGTPSERSEPSDGRDVRNDDSDDAGTQAELCTWASEVQPGTPAAADMAVCSSRSEEHEHGQAVPPDEKEGLF